MKKSFTLIELLVVIAIIGILAAIIIVNVSSARVKARDARRKSDLDSIRTAIEMYIEQNGQPPGASLKVYNSTNSDDWAELQTYLSPYLTTLPKDPQNTLDKEYRYMNNISTGAYELDAALEVDPAKLNVNDGGNNNDRYEIGTDLKLMLYWVQG